MLLSFFEITLLKPHSIFGIRIPESGKFWLLESGILENFVKESGIPGRRKTQTPCKVEPKFKSKPCCPSFHLSALSFQLS